jgi:hypothetical protein
MATLNSIQINDTGFIRTTAGTLAERSGTTTASLRYNSTISRHEHYNGTTWKTPLLTGLGSSASDPATASSILTTFSSTRSISVRNQQLSLGISLPTLKPQTSYGYDGMLAFDAPPSPNWSQMNSADSGNSSGGNFFFSVLDNAAPPSPSNSVDNSSTPQQDLSPNDSPLLRSTALPSHFPGGLLLSEVRSRTMSEFSISSVTSTGVRPSRSVSFLDFEPARDVIVFKPTALIAPPVDSNPLLDSGAESGGDSSVTHTSSGVSDDDALAEEMDDEDDDAYYSSTRSDQSIDGSAADDDDGELAHGAILSHDLVELLGRGAQARLRRVNLPPKVIQQLGL